MALIWKTIHWCRQLHHLAMPRNLPPGCRSGLNTFCLDAYQMCCQSSTFPPNEQLLTLTTLPHSVKETLILFFLALDVGVLRDVVAVGPLIPTVWQGSMGNWGTYWASWSLLSFLAFSSFTSQHPPSVHTHINMDGCVFLCIVVFVWPVYVYMSGVAVPQLQYNIVIEDEGLPLLLPLLVAASLGMWVLGVSRAYGHMIWCSCRPTSLGVVIQRG